jgi:predicted DNA-binding WGR domain protein
MAEWNVHLEFREGSSNKFWRGRVEGGELLTNWGCIGTDGQTKSKSLGSADAALAELEKQAAKKRKKGYADVGGGAEAAPAEAAPEPESYEASLTLKDEGRSIALSLSVDGASLKTEVQEAYESEEAARAAFARIRRQLIEDGYSE